MRPAAAVPLAAAVLAAAAVFVFLLPAARAVDGQSPRPQLPALASHLPPTGTPVQASTRRASPLHAEPLAPTAAASQQRSQRRPFRHGQHESLECQACHDTQRAHGRVTIAAPRDCDQCHHRDTRADTCERCHAAGAEAGVAYSRTLDMTVAGRSAARDLSFDHAEHADIDCARCHSGLTMAVGPAACLECHTDHHQTVRDCAVCHRQAPASAHPRTVHVTCTGAGCHDAGFLTGNPRTPQVCLSCHREQSDHRPGESCAECHLLPPWRG